MKKRVAGGVVLVAIGIGIWLSNLFNGLGPGGAGTNVGMNPDTLVSVNLDASTAAEAAQESETEAGVVGSGRPVVVIDDLEYFLEQRTGENVEYVPVALERIVALAQGAEPDADGIRVQIKRRGSSRQSAETALDAALSSAGVTEQQIQRHAGFVE